MTTTTTTTQLRLDGVRGDTARIHGGTRTDRLRVWAALDRVGMRTMSGTHRLPGGTNYLTLREAAREIADTERCDIHQTWHNINTAAARYFHQYR